MPAITDARSAVVSSDQQTYLVGEEVYLRPATADDADLVQSWTHQRFPISPDHVRTRLDEGKRGDDSGSGRHQLLIVRRRDDRPVGSLILATKWFPHVWIEVATDPLFEPDIDRWRGEALAMAMRHVIDEWQLPIVTVSIDATARQTIAALERIGARVCLRLPEVRAVAGERVDTVMYELLHADWLARLGDPAEAEQPRSGTGQPRPVVAPRAAEGDPPANAVRVGPRVYLRPVEERDARETVRLRLRERDATWSSGRFVEPAGGWWKEQKTLQEHAHPEWVRFAVCLRENDRLIGFVGVEEIDWQHRHGESESELLDPDFRERGYGSEAKHLLFDYAFNTLDLHILLSWVSFPNTRSAAALRKQGYTDAGRVHWLVPADGTFGNMGIFHLRAEAWRAMPRDTDEEGR